jgi:hypothetical protein
LFLGKVDKKQKLRLFNRVSSGLVRALLFGMKTILLFILSGFLSLSVFGASLCPETVARLGGEGGDTLREVIQELTASRSARNTRLEALREQIGSTEAHLAELQSQMGFREKYLCGRLGGSRELVRRVKRYAAIRDKRREFVQRNQSEIEDLNARVTEEVVTWLVQNDQTVGQVVEAKQRLAKMLKATRGCLSCVNDAQSSVSSAQTYETLDMVSDNQGLSALSYMQTSSANDHIEEVNAAVARLNRLLREEGQAVQGELAGVSDLLDLVADQFGNGFDFSSLMNLSSLSSASSSLEDIETRVRQVHDGLDERYREVKQTINAYVAEASKQL